MCLEAETSRSMQTMDLTEMEATALKAILDLSIGRPMQNAISVMPQTCSRAC